MNETTEKKEQDLSGVTLLGNQNTKYEFDYNPDLLEVFKRHYDPMQDFLGFLDLLLRSLEL